MISFRARLSSDLSVETDVVASHASSDGRFTIYGDLVGSIVEQKGRNAVDTFGLISSQETLSDLESILRVGIGQFYLFSRLDDELHVYASVSSPGLLIAELPGSAGILLTNSEAEAIRECGNANELDPAELLGVVMSHHILV